MTRKTSVSRVWVWAAGPCPGGVKVSHMPSAPPVSAAVAWMTMGAPKGVRAMRSRPGAETTSVPACVIFSSLLPVRAICPGEGPAVSSAL